MPDSERPSASCWEAAAHEIRREAQVRGDLDERTVQALAAHLDRLSRGHVEGHCVRDSRAWAAWYAPAQNDHERQS